ncbi:hypothetical protein ZIOFF_070295 [Zingiber officinale]|uniref:Uncharacterized protein n=1 Tax=Zingiber officinale TaxID=94328 RepID=A0A8J5CEE4_ZINOF|nr:hypothetical protein ZIOFF_070295 [Zingiber officinale]
MASFSWTEEDVLWCCGNKLFAKELASASPFSNLHHDLPASPLATAALVGTTDGPANDEGNLSDAKGLAKEAAFLFQNRRFQECVEILSQIFDKKRGDAKAIILYHIHEYAQSLSVLKKLFQNIEPIEEQIALRVYLLLLDVALACEDILQVLS